jgi:hypothetical protein
MDLYGALAMLGQTDRTWCDSHWQALISMLNSPTIARSALRWPAIWSSMDRWVGFVWCFGHAWSDRSNVVRFALTRFDFDPEQSNCDNISPLLASNSIQHGQRDLYGALAMLVQTDRTRLDVDTEQSNRSQISPPLACNSIQYRWMGGICKLGAIHTDKLKFQYWTVQLQPYWPSIGLGSDPVLTDERDLYCALDILSWTNQTWSDAHWQALISILNSQTVARWALHWPLLRSSMDGLYMVLLLY